MQPLVLCLGRSLHSIPCAVLSVSPTSSTALGKPTYMTGTVEFPEALQTKAWSEKLWLPINLGRHSRTEGQEQQAYYLNNLGKKSTGKHQRGGIAAEEGWELERKLELFPHIQIKEPVNKIQITSSLSISFNSGALRALLLPNSTQQNTSCLETHLNALLTKFSVKILLRGAFTAWPQPLGTHRGPQIQTVWFLSVWDLKKLKIVETYHMHKKWGLFSLLSSLMLAK